MKTLGLYVRYAVRSFIRGRSRSIFGAFCVAVGVASVVALGLVGGNFRSAVTGDGQKTNRGDIHVTLSTGNFTPQQVALFDSLKRRGLITDYTTRMQDGLQVRSVDSNRDATIGTVYGVDPRRFPFYDPITADEPHNVALRTVMATPGSAVVSHSIYDSLALHVGPRIAVA